VPRRRVFSERVRAKTPFETDPVLANRNHGTRRTREACQTDSSLPACFRSDGYCRWYRSDSPGSNRAFYSPSFLSKNRAMISRASFVSGK
jgi:hypothetical protein